MIATPDAVEVFVRAFCFLRSFTRPYVPERLGPSWLLHDAPPTPRPGRAATGRRDPRKAEVIAYDIDPAEVVAAWRAPTAPASTPPTRLPAARHAADLLPRPSARVGPAAQRAAFASRRSAATAPATSRASRS